MSVRAKFRVDGIERTRSSKYEGGKSIPIEVQTIRMTPVCGDGEENKKFFASTPWGEIKLGTVNAEAAKQFDLGKEYFVDFTPAE